MVENMQSAARQAAQAGSIPICTVLIHTRSGHRGSGHIMRKFWPAIVENTLCVMHKGRELLHFLRMRWLQATLL